MRIAFLDSSVLFTAVNSPYGGSSKLFTLKNIKIVTTIHGWVSKGGKLPFYYFFDKIQTAFFDKIFILYRSQTKNFLLQPTSSKLVVIHNAIDPQEWDSSLIQKGKIHQEFGIPEDSPLIGFVGRIMPEKDLLTLMRVANNLIHNRKISCRFILIGEGKDLEYENIIKPVQHWVETMVIGTMVETITTMTDTITAITTATTTIITTMTATGMTGHGGWEPA